MVDSVEPNPDDIGAVMNQLSTDFDKLCQDRHDKGQEEYGAVTFLSNDIIRMMVEELADTANYCRYQFIKLMMLQAVLEEDLAKRGVADPEGNITLGVQAFKGVGDVGWSKP